MVFKGDLSMTSIFMRQIFERRKKHRLHLTLEVKFKILDAVKPKLQTLLHTKVQTEKMVNGDKDKV